MKLLCVPTCFMISLRLTIPKALWNQLTYRVLPAVPPFEMPRTGRNRGRLRRGLAPPAVPKVCWLLLLWWVFVCGFWKSPRKDENQIEERWTPLNILYCNRTFANKVKFDASLLLLCFAPTAKLAMGSLAQNSSGAIRCSCNTRFRRRFRSLPLQMADEVSESSEADGWRGSKGFRCRWPMRFGRFRGRWLMRFQRVVVQMADEVLESSGADSQKPFKIFQAVGDNTWVYIFIFVNLFWSKCCSSETCTKIQLQLDPETNINMYCSHWRHPVEGMWHDGGFQGKLQA